MNFTLFNTTSDSQVDAYDERKRPYTAAFVNVNVKKRYTYDRKGAVNRPFGWDSNTVVRHRVVYVEKRTAFTAKNVPYFGGYGRIH